jgi:hypothetical protein
MVSNKSTDKPISESMPKHSDNSNSSDLGTLELLFKPFSKNGSGLATPEQGVRLSLDRIVNKFKPKVTVSDSEESLQSLNSYEELLKLRGA